MRRYLVLLLAGLALLVPASAKAHDTTCGYWHGSAHIQCIRNYGYQAVYAHAKARQHGLTNRPIVNFIWGEDWGPHSWRIRYIFTHINPGPYYSGHDYITCWGFVKLSSHTGRVIPPFRDHCHGA